MKKLLLGAAAVATLGLGSQAYAHCGACGDIDNHGDKAIDATHAADKHVEAADIVDTAAGNEDFATLVAAVQAAGLVDALKGDGPFTVFAPTNAAFEALPEGAVEDLLKPENKEKLQSVLKFHVVSGKIKAEDIANGSTNVPSLQGDEINVVKSAAGVSVNGANVTATDIKTSNGIIHVIDAVIMP
ncbi:MAG: fasciclin domain-containing protein [Bdellovibrionales bacterium]